MPKRNIAALAAQTENVPSTTTEVTQAQVLAQQELEAKAAAVATKKSEAQLAVEAKRAAKATEKAERVAAAQKKKSDTAAAKLAKEAARATEKAEKPTRARRVVTPTPPPIIAPIELTPDLPWASWPIPTTKTVDFENMRVVPDPRGLRLIAGDESLGVFGTAALEQLSIHTQFPPNFVAKLNPGLQAAVVNDRLEKHRDQTMQVISEDDQVSNIFSNWHEVVSHADIAQYAFDRLSDLVGEVNIIRATQDVNGLRLRLMTTREMAVTPAVGDVLRFGIDIEHRYGQLLSLSAFVERLHCLNGMTVETGAFKWQQRLGGTRAHQLNWLEEGLIGALEAYTALVTRAQIMAATQFSGDAHSVLRDRAARLNIAPSQMGAVVTAFDEEPGNTEWHLLNAVTRFATHSETVSAVDRRRFQRSAGNWVQDFDIVTARLPRPIALRVGAELVTPAGELIAA